MCTRKAPSSPRAGRKFNTDLSESSSCGSDTSDRLSPYVNLRNVSFNKNGILLRKCELLLGVALYWRRRFKAAVLVKLKTVLTMEPQLFFLLRQFLSKLKRVIRLRNSFISQSSQKLIKKKNNFLFLHRHLNYFITNEVNLIENCFFRKCCSNAS